MNPRAIADTLAAAPTGTTWRGYGHNDYGMRGGRLEFPNGRTLSIVWGRGTYSGDRTVEVAYMVNDEIRGLPPWFEFTSQQGLGGNPRGWTNANSLRWIVYTIGAMDRPVQSAPDGPTDTEGDTQ